MVATNGATTDLFSGRGSINATTRTTFSSSSPLSHVDVDLDYEFEGYIHNSNNNNNKYYKYI